MPKMNCVARAVVCLSLLSACAASRPANLYAVDPAENLARLLAVADTDHDHKITVRDHPAAFTLRETNGAAHEVRGVYPLSVLLQELTLADQEKQNVFRFAPGLLAENPADRTGRLIRERFWDGLTRKLDGDGLQKVLFDEKTRSADGRFYLYVPADDAYAFAYYESLLAERPELRISLRRVPEKITPEFLRELNGQQGLLSLKVQRDADGRPAPVPFVVPGGRFNEMYGWDSYFIALGLLADARTDLARGLVDNQAYQIRYYGKILNANRTYYLTRSQPPFFTSLLRAVYEALPPSPENRAWLKENLGLAMQEYREVWASPPRLDARSGLSRYFDEGEGPCPEVEPGAYDALLLPFAKKAKLSPAALLTRFESGKYQNAELRRAFHHDRTVRETGHDTTYRFRLRAADFLTVDLNALLFKYENDIADLLEKEWGGRLKLDDGREESASAWRELAEQRRVRFQKTFWDEAKGTFYDYDLKERARSGYDSATSLYALWAGLATPEQAARTWARARDQLVKKGGLAASSLSSRGPLHPPARPQRQWDFPYGWPPHQVLAWEALRRYGLRAEGEGMALAWLEAIATNARDFNGMVTEKYDVEKASHEAFAEYGNVGSTFSYITREGFGWTNASYQLGLRYLSAENATKLRAAVR